MRKPLIIGDRTFKFKKDAILHYRKILNSYNFGQSLNSDDFDDLINLLLFEHDKTENNSEIQEIENFQVIDEEIKTENNEELEILDIKVSKVQFNTKCFEIFWNDLTSEYISYIMLVNNTKYNPDSLFSIACRNSIQNDMISVKQKYFSENSIKGFVKCQETNELSKWEDLAVDHRQPNTFSVIVDRFKEVNKIEVDKIEYETNEVNLILFKNLNLIEDFRDYHKEKANLRIVRKECNLSRTGMARLKRSAKDLSIE